MIRAVVDSNVLFSALMSPNGIPASVIRSWREGAFTLITSPALLVEFERALEYPRIKSRMAWTDQDRDRFIHLLVANSIAKEVNITVEDLTDPHDRMFIEAAVAGEADYIVSGDSALLRVGEYEGIAIVTPRRFLAILEAGKSP